MRHTITALTLALTVGGQLAAQEPGITEFNIAAPHHDRDMQVSVTFPATGGLTTLFADNAVF